MGFEVAAFVPCRDGYRVHGATSAVDDGAVWHVEYDIVLDAAWTTRRVRIASWSPAGRRTVALDHEDAGSWSVNGRLTPDLDDCLDVDLESSVLTNAFPVHRQRSEPGSSWSAPAAYVRAADLTIGRLDQRYTYLVSDERHRYAYEAPALEFRCQIDYDACGLVLHYPGIAVRAT